MLKLLIQQKFCPYLANQQISRRYWSWSKHCCSFDAISPQNRNHIRKCFSMSKSVAWTVSIRHKKKLGAKFSRHCLSLVENDNAEERIGKETADRFVSSGSHIVYCMFNPCAHGCSRLYGMRCRKLHGISVVYTVQNTYTVMITTQYSVFSS